MKTSTLPALRVTPRLRRELERVLGPDETLSGFMEAALLSQLDWRRTQREFIEAGLAEGERARAENDYLDAAEVVSRLDAVLARARRGRKARRPTRKA